MGISPTINVSDNFTLLSRQISNQTKWPDVNNLKTRPSDFTNFKIYLISSSTLLQSSSAPLFSLAFMYLSEEQRAEKLSWLSRDGILCITPCIFPLRTYAYVELTLKPI